MVDRTIVDGCQWFQNHMCIVKHMCIYIYTYNITLITTSGRDLPRIMVGIGGSIPIQPYLRLVNDSCAQIYSPVNWVV